MIVTIMKMYLLGFLIMDIDYNVFSSIICVIALTCIFLKIRENTSMGITSIFHLLDSDNLLLNNVKRNEGKEKFSQITITATVSQSYPELCLIAIRHFQYKSLGHHLSMLNFLTRLNTSAVFTHTVPNNSTEKRIVFKQKG